MFGQENTAPVVTLEDLLEKIEYHRNEQILLMEQVEEHLPEGFSIVQNR